MTRPSALPLDALVDPVCGVVRSVGPVPHPAGAPPRYTAMTAEVADARLLGAWPADRVSLGTTFGDPEGARIAAVAEAVERYCGNRVPPAGHPDEPLRATARELTAKGLELYGPDDVPLHADWQYSREESGGAAFPYQQLTDDTPALWTRASELRAGGEPSEVWAPVSLTHLNWRQGELRTLPRTHHLNYAGIATGQGLDDAVERGLLEVVERDAMELWWQLGGPTRGVDPSSVPGLDVDLAGCVLRVWIVEMPSEFAPCMAALVYDAEREVYAAGFACRFDPAEAARKAVLEAVHTWVFTLGVVAADGWVFQSVEAGLLARGLYLPHRADRRYLDSCGRHFGAVRDLGAHVQVWLDERVGALAKRFTEPTGGVVSIQEVAPGSRTRLDARLAEGGHRVVAADLTTEDIAETELRVARVLVSGLIPNAPAAFGYFGCPRFGDAALARGWRTHRPTGPGDFTLTPPPHM